MAYQTGQRMQKDWAGMPSFENDFTADATLGVGGLSPGQSATVIRMLGEYFISSTDGGAFSAGDSAHIGVGIAVVSTDAFSAGGASLPDPLGSADYPWLYWADHPLFVFDGTVAEGLSLATRRVTFDIRSKRKMKAVETLVLIVQYSDLTGALPLTFSGGQTRVLLAGL